MLDNVIELTIFRRYDHGILVEEENALILGWYLIKYVIAGGNRSLHVQAFWGGTVCDKRETDREREKEEKWWI